MNLNINGTLIQDHQKVVDTQKNCWYAKKAVDTQKETKGLKIKFLVFHIPGLVSQPFSELDFIGNVIAWD